MRTSWLVGGSAGAGIGAAIVVLGVANADGGFVYVNVVPFFAVILLLLAFLASAARRALLPLGLLSSAASVALLVAGWEMPLSAAQTERAVAIAHPNFRKPITCHRVTSGGMLTQRYECSWRDSTGAMAFDVNDSKIVAEYP